MGSSIREREHFFDNAKFLLIILVVMGHVIEPIRNYNSFINALFQLIYTFHMPAFILIAGFFAKRIDNFQVTLSKSAIRILVPCIVFEILYYPFFNEFYSFFIEPYFALWFLVSLFCWKLMLTLFVRFKYPIAVSISVFGAILAGYIPFIGYEFSISRTLVFFPFFLAGYYLKKEHFQMINRRIIRLLSVLIASALVCALTLLNIDIVGLLKGASDYTQIGYAQWFAGGYRLFVYAIFTVMCIAFFSFVPKQKTIFSKLGTMTLYPFLLHAFIIRGFEMIGGYDLITSPLSVLLLILSSIILGTLLSLPWVKIFKPIVEPYLYKQKNPINLTEPR